MENTAIWLVEFAFLIEKKNENTDLKKKDCDTTIPVYSLVHYHTCKLILIQVTSAEFEPVTSGIII